MRSRANPTRSRVGIWPSATIASFAIGATSTAAGIRPALIGVAGIAVVFAPAPALIAAIFGRTVVDQYLPNATVTVTFGVFVLALAVAARTLLDRRVWNIRSDSIGVILFALSFVPGFVVAFDTPLQGAALREAARLVVLVVTYLALRHTRTAPTPHDAIRLLWFAVMTQAGLAVAQIVGDQRLFQDRPPGGFAHAGILALFMVMALNLSLGWALHDFERTRRAPRAAITVLAIEALILGLASSFTAFIAVLGTSALWALLLSGKSRRYRRIVRTIVVSAIGIAGPFVGARLFRETSQALPTSGIFGLNSVAWRLGNWRGLAPLIRQRPLLGNGLTSSTYLNPTQLYVDANNTIPADPHSEVVRMLVETGFIGLSISVAALCLIGVALWRARLAVRGHPKERLADGALTALLGFALASVPDHTLGATSVQLVFLAMLAWVFRYLCDATDHEQTADRPTARIERASIPPRVTEHVRQLSNHQAEQRKDLGGNRNPFTHWARHRLEERA